MVNCRKSIAIAFLLSAGCGGGGTSSNHTASTPPPVNGVISSASYSNGVVTLNGTDFGTKTTPAPFYFSDFESDLIGQIPAGQFTNVTRTGTVQRNKTHAGSSSLEFDYCTDAYLYTWTAGSNYLTGNVVSYGGQNYTLLNAVTNAATTPNNDQINYQPGAPVSSCSNGRRHDDWRRNAIDLGSGGSEKIFVSYWLYLDNGASTSTNWQWKSTGVYSSSQLYGLPASNLSAMFLQPWCYPFEPRWGGNYGEAYYDSVGNSPGLDNPNVLDGLKVQGNSPSAAGAYLTGQWQRMDLYFQRSSSGGVADGQLIVNRIGKGSTQVDRRDAVTHVAADDPWRYVVLSHALESVFDGHAQFTVFMDDIYIDTTQARVEMCDSSTWSSRSHCELQPPVSWSPTQIKTNFRKGSFKSGEQVYFYTVGDTGLVSNASSAFTIP